MTLDDVHEVSGEILHLILEGLDLGGKEVEGDDCGNRRCEAHRGSDQGMGDVRPYGVLVKDCDFSGASAAVFKSAPKKATPPSCSIM